MSDTTTTAENTSVGKIYLPSNPGQPVGKFQFLLDLIPSSPNLDAAENVEVGSFVAVDTAEGTVIGTVTDMHVVGSVGDPISADLSGFSDQEMATVLPDATVATAQVLLQDRLRPVRSGTVRFATADEVGKALGQDKMRWKIPVGTVKLGTGELMPVCLDGDYVTGHEAASSVIQGRSGMASKSSFSMYMLKSILQTGAAAGEDVAALVVNVKGEDFLRLDEKPDTRKALTDQDLEMYRATGIKPEPFENVQVYAPSLPGGSESNSSREDAQLLRWDLPMIWKHLPSVFDVSNDNLRNLLADIETSYIDPAVPAHKRITTIAQLDNWFQDKFEEYEDEDSDRKGGGAWKSHHISTLRRAHRLISSLVPRFGGLVSREGTRPEYDIPDTAWKHNDVVVMDLAGLTADVAGIVMGRTIKRLFQSAEEGTLGVSRLVVVVDELNQFAPAQGTEFSGVRKAIRDILARGRYAGISALGACQILSKVDHEVVQNASTKVTGITDHGELTSGAFGSKLPEGFVEQVTTLKPGQMGMWHHTFRAPIVVNFPRPAWAAGKSTEIGKTIRKKSSALDAVKVSDESKKNLTEGLDQAAAEHIVANADDPKKAVEELLKNRVPDMRRQHLHTAKQVDDEDPFGLGE